jgi:hypothetical protein
MSRLIHSEYARQGLARQLASAKIGIISIRTIGQNLIAAEDMDAANNPSERIEKELLRK